MNSSHNIQKVIKTTLILFIVVLAVLKSGSVMGQRKAVQKINYGVEGAIGTRSFHFKSDIAELHKSNTFLTGQNFGVMVGGKKIHAKVRMGSFKTEATAAQKFKMAETELAVNVYPLQLKNKKFRYFEPYFFTGADRSAIKFYGDYVSTNGTVPGLQTGTVPGTTIDSTPKEEGGTLVCCCDGSIPANPYQLVDIQASPSSNPTSVNDALRSDLTATAEEDISEATVTESYLGKVMTTRANIGFGLECHIPGANHFINLFAEVKYGFAINNTSNHAAFRGTSASGQVAVNFGLSFGLSK
jgi:hypothetical protein